MPTPPQLRLLLVDDHLVVRMGLATLLSLEPDLTVVAEAEDGEQAIECFRATSPDVVLMDVRMPKLDGIKALQRLREEFPAVKVIMLTTSELDWDVQLAMEAGACGYVHKSVSRGELVRAVRQVHGGSRYIPERLQVRLQELETLKPLSARELEVLKGMRLGLTNRDIATSLSISEHTVRTHVKTILQKLESADRTEAVARGFEKGLLHIPDKQTPQERT